MAIRVTSDRVKGGGINLMVTTTDVVAYRRFYVTGMAAGLGPNLTFAASVAIDESDGFKVPIVGEPYSPEYGQFVCTQKEVIPTDGTKSVQITCMYEDTLAIKVFVDGHLISRSTPVDAKGKDLKVRYWADKDSKHWSQEGGTPQLVDAQVERPITTLGFEYWATVDPYRWLDYLTFYNKDQWQGDPAHTWRFDRLSVTDTIGTVNNNLWRVRASFTRMKIVKAGGGTSNPIETWDQVLMYQDHRMASPTPHNVRPVEAGYPNLPPRQDGSIEGNGWKVAELYPEADFAMFGVPDVLKGQRSIPRVPGP